MIASHLSHARNANPPGSDHTMDIDELIDPEVRFWGFYDGTTAVGCGALKQLADGTSEVKSVHVIADARGRGLGRQIMAFLADTARSEGSPALVLETGSALLPRYDAARGLYLALGYEHCDPIPGYATDPNSVFLRLPLDR